jgi:hypothetical protein
MLTKLPFCFDRKGILSLIQGVVDDNYVSKHVTINWIEPNFPISILIDDTLVETYNALPLGDLPRFEELTNRENLD